MTAANPDDYLQIDLAALTLEEDKSLGVAASASAAGGFGMEKEVDGSGTTHALKVVDEVKARTHLRNYVLQNPPPIPSQVPKEVIAMNTEQNLNQYMADATGSPVIPPPVPQTRRPNTATELVPDRQGDPTIRRMNLDRNLNYCLGDETRDSCRSKTADTERE